MTTSKPRSIVRHRLAKQLLQHRVKRGWSQENLAEAAELDRTHVSLIERERCNVGLDTLESIANGLGVEVADLFRS
jgi:transcriptional regulator with XRE-family HTH domain